MDHLFAKRISENAVEMLARTVPTGFERVPKRVMLAGDD
jgi:hypothetical protein